MRVGILDMCGRGAKAALAASLILSWGPASAAEDSKDKKEAQKAEEKEGKNGKSDKKKADKAKVKGAEAKKAAEASGGSGAPVVKVKTSKGAVKIRLNPKKAPVTVKNFLSYVEDDFYDGTVFHRVIKGFMIQGGGFEIKDGKLHKKETRDPIKNEAQNGLENDRGTIAMARTSDPDSASSQFFINHKDNANLNYPKPDGHGYTVFGKVVDGMDVVDKIAAVSTTSRSGRRNVPEENVVIKDVTLVKGGS